MSTTTPTKRAVIIYGILSLSSFISIFFVCLSALLVDNILADSTLLEATFVVTFLSFYLVLLLLVIRYLFAVWRDPRRDRMDKIFWTLGLLFAGGLAVPYYWFKVYWEHYRAWKFYADFESQNPVESR